MPRGEDSSSTESARKTTPIALTVVFTGCHGPEICVGRSCEVRKLMLQFRDVSSRNSVDPRGTLTKLTSSSLHNSLTTHRGSAFDGRRAMRVGDFDGCVSCWRSHGLAFRTDIGAQYRRRSDTQSTVITVLAEQSWPNATFSPRHATSEYAAGMIASMGMPRRAYYWCTEGARTAGCVLAGKPCLTDEVLVIDA